MGKRINKQKAVETFKLCKKAGLRIGAYFIIGYVDEEGYYFLSGRSSDIIIRAGENISPEELENVIREHPGVEDVAVIGVPDETWGEEPRAVVIPRKGVKVTEEEIMEYCRQNLASFKRPRTVVFVKDLPRNPLGKLIKKEIGYDGDVIFCLSRGSVRADSLQVGMHLAARADRLRAMTSARSARPTASGSHEA